MHDRISHMKVDGKLTRQQRRKLEREAAKRHAEGQRQLVFHNLTDIEPGDYVILPDEQGNPAAVSISTLEMLVAGQLFNPDGAPPGEDELGPVITVSADFKRQAIVEMTRRKAREALATLPRHKIGGS